MPLMAPRNRVGPLEYSEAMTTRDDVPTLQLEVLKKIQAELVNLKHEVTSLKTDLAGVKTELTGVKTEIAGVRTELKTELGELRRETHEGFMRVRTELVGLRDDLEVGFTAMGVQNDRRFLDHERRLRELESGR